MINRVARPVSRPDSLRVCLRRKAELQFSGFLHEEDKIVEARLVPGVMAEAVVVLAELEVAVVLMEILGHLAWVNELIAVFEEEWVGLAGSMGSAPCLMMFVVMEYVRMV